MQTHAVRLLCFVCLGVQLGIGFQSKRSLDGSWYSVYGCNWTFWGNLTPTDYYNGLVTMKEKGFNTLRVYIVNSLRQHPESQWEYFWRAIKESGLSLMPTIFQTFNKTHELNMPWEEQKVWVDYILGKLEEYQFDIVAVDLSGEPGFNETSLVRRVYDYAKDRLKDYEITVGFSPTKTSIETAKALDDICTIHSPHYYLGFWSSFDAWLRAWLDFNKPLLIGEWGYEAPISQEDEQYDFDKEMLDKFKNLTNIKFMGQLVWDWKDLPDGKSYWGILREDGTPKPSFTLFP